MTTKSRLETLPAEIQVQIIALCDLDGQKAWRQTCRALYLTASGLPYGQVYLAAREKTLSAALSICRDDDHRKRAAGLVIDVVTFAEGAHREPGMLKAMYLAKQELRKPGFDQWKPTLAKKEYGSLCDGQNRCIEEHHARRFLAVLRIALTRLDNIQTIRMTNRFSDWYYSEGPLSWDVKFAPFPAMSTAKSLGVFTLALFEELWETRQTRSSKIKSLITEIVGDLNAHQEIAGIPYDAIYWGAKFMYKGDDRALEAVLKGFEELSMDISRKRYYTGHGRFSQRPSQDVTLAQKRIEWVGIGKMIAGAEHLSSLDIRFRDETFDHRFFEDCMTHHHWVNLTTLHLCNFLVTAQDLLKVLETHVKLDLLALERAAIVGELQPNGAVLGLPADLPVWADLAGRVAGVLTLKKVALLCLQEFDGEFGNGQQEYSMGSWTCDRAPMCRYGDVEQAMLAGRANKWNEQDHQKHLLTCSDSG